MDYIIIWLCGYVVMWLCGYVVIRKLGKRLFEI